MQPEGYFAPVISGNLITILNGIREAHKKDTTTADEDSAAAEVARSLKEEFVTLIGILKKSKKLQDRQGCQRGKVSPQIFLLPLLRH